MSREFQQHIERARQQIRHQDLRGAIESLRRALSIDADDAAAHALLSLCLHDERRLHAATHEARLALTLDPHLPFAHYALAICEQAARRFASAEEHLRQAIAGDPESADYLLALASLYSLWKRTAEALPLIEKARALAPDDPACWAALADHQREQRKFGEAKAAAQRALELDPQHTAALLAMGHSLLHEGDTQAAREHALLVLRENALHSGAITLLTAVKARESLFLGLWWRLNSFFVAGSITRRVLLLVGLFLVYRVAVMLTADLGYSGASLPLNIVWLAFCVYTWTGPTLFQKQIERELAPARLDPKY